MEKYIDEVFFIERSNGTFCYHRNSRLARSYSITNRVRGDCYAYLRTTTTGLVEFAGALSATNKSSVFCETYGHALKFHDENGSKVSRNEFQRKCSEMTAALSALIMGMRYTKDSKGTFIRDLFYKSIIDTSPPPFPNGTCFYLFSKSHRVIRFSNVDLSECLLIKPTVSMTITNLCVNPYMMEERGYKKIDSSVFYKLFNMIKIMNSSFASEKTMYKIV